MAGKRSRSRAKDASSGKRSQPHTRRPRKKPKTDTLSMPASKILSMGTVKSAVSSLLKDAEVYERKRAKRAEAKGKVVGELMTDESFVNIMITFREPPFKGKLRPCAIPLKHTLFLKDEDKVCLFVKDPQRLVKDYLAENGNGGVTRVLGIEKLRKEYKTHEGRRELLNQYDHFLVDARVAPMMPNLLGNAFLKAKKMPLAVRMDKDVVRAIERCLGSTSFTPRQGTSCSIRVARGDWAENEVVENVLAVVDGVIQKLRRGWSDVQSVNLKTNKSPALPIYVSLPGINGNKTTEVKSTAEQAEKIKMNTEAAEGVNELLKSTSDKNEEGEDDDGEGENEEEEGENEEEESDDEEEEGVRMGDLVEMWADDDDEDESESEEEQGDISDDGDEKKVEKLRKDEVGSDEDAVVGEDNTKKGTGARSSKAKAQESDRHHVPLRRSSRKAVLKKAETATYDEDINSSDSGNDSSEGDGQKAKEATEATPRRSARKVKPTATPKKDGDEGMQTPRRSQRKPNAKTVKTIEKASTGGSGSGRKLRSARKASSTRR